MIIIIVIIIMIIIIIIIIIIIKTYGCVLYCLYSRKMLSKA